ncbi:hypothetical protein RI367_006901 [Sorochytrium milnesiophthora]
MAAPQSDCDVLNAWYQQMQKPAALTGWGQGNCCSGSWTGVGCVGQGQVSSLSIGGKGLWGRLPDALGHLPRLEDLDVSNNGYLVGHIPTSIWSKTWNTFKINSCSFTGIVPNVPIPQTWDCAVDHNAFQCQRAAGTCDSFCSVLKLFTGSFWANAGDAVEEADNSVLVPPPPSSTPPPSSSTDSDPAGFKPVYVFYCFLPVLLIIVLRLIRWRYIRNQQSGHRGVIITSTAHTVAPAQYVGSSAPQMVSAMPSTYPVEQCDDPPPPPFSEAIRKPAVLMPAEPSAPPFNPAYAPAFSPSTPYAPPHDPSQ